MKNCAVAHGRASPYIVITFDGWLQHCLRQSSADACSDEHGWIVLQVRRTRATQRAGRQRADRPLCSVVGYTNAGKSSLVSALSGSYVEAEDR